MSDKSFEQQVREELSDLRMKPNAAVWEFVAASLKKDRKRRWAVWMVFLLAGISGTALWWVAQEQSKGIEFSKINQVKNNIPAKNQSETVVVSDSTILYKDQQHKHTAATLVQESENLAESARDKTNAIAKATVISQLKSNNATILSVENENKKEEVVIQRIADSGNKVISVAVDEQKKSVLLSDSVLPKTEALTTSLQQGLVSVIQDSITKEMSDAIIKKTDYNPSIVSDSIKQMSKSNKKISKWQWRIGVSMGTSGVRNSLRTLLEKRNENAYTNAFTGNATPITPPGTGTSNAGNTKLVVRDAFSVGGSVELLRKMGKKEQHAVGLTAGYYLYKTTTGVGNENTGTVQFSNVDRANEENKYYSIKDSAKYTSYYHFIQLGLKYYRSVKWLKKTDMQLYGGIAVNALLGSNGLHLGTNNTGIYLFKNNSLLRSLQMDISGGIDFSLGKSRQMYFGPQVQYMLSNLSKQPGVNQHLFRPSVRLSFLLDKRK